MTATTIKRGFADLPHGQIHYRHSGFAEGGSGEPLLLLHASPGSSRQLVGMITSFAGDAQVIAPDTPGNGDSIALPQAKPSITDLAIAMLEFIDSLGVPQVNLYGTHTGAAIAAELAILAPHRVKRLVLDGVSLLTAAELEDFLARYAAPFPPDLDGAYLIRAFQFCRDQFLFFPWYDRTRQGRRDSGLPAAADLQALVVEVLKASESYHHNYHAAFKWDAQLRLPLVPCRALIISAQNDPLAGSTKALAPLLADGRYLSLPRFDDPEFRAIHTRAIAAFLTED